MLRRILDRLGLHRSSRQQPRSPSRFPSPTRTAPRKQRTSEPVPPPGPGAAQRWTQRLTFEYAPKDDDKPDPGEIVWTWVPYEENPKIGKDRPVVVMSTIRPGLLGVVPLSSQPHHGDPRWLVIGSGAWDPQRRTSAVRLDFVLAVSDEAVRREGSALDRYRFAEIADALQARHGW